MPDIHSFEPLWNEWYIKDALGSGSYGTVYKIEKRELGESYFAALKHISIPPTGTNGRGSYIEETEDVTGTVQERYRDLLDSLLAEIKINNRLKGYTNIVSYEDHRVITRPDAMGYDVIIKMELLTSLSELLSQRVLTVGDVVRLGREISTALMVLQQNKIIHRDIKPANIFVNAGGNFKLGDFGVAKVMELATEGMSMKGTLSYMAPEVARGEIGDYRLDIYSLGLVLYRLLNYNRGPFLPLPPEKVTHTQASEANRRRMRGEMIPPPAMADEQLGEIILRACAFSPEDRWDSAEELRLQLEQYQNTASADALATIAIKQQSLSGANTSAAATADNSMSSAAQKKETQETLVDHPPIDQTAHLEQATERTMLLGATGWDDAVNEKTEVITSDFDEEHTVLLRSVDVLEGTLPQPAQSPLQERPPEEKSLGEHTEGDPGENLSTQEEAPVPSNTKRHLPLIPIFIAGGMVLLAIIICVIVVLNGHKTQPPRLPSSSEEFNASEELNASGEPSLDPNEIVAVWHDSTMEAAIRRILNKPQGDILIDELSELQEVRLTEETDLTLKTLGDLEYMPNLKVLRLNEVKLQSADMSALGNLSKLEALHLTDCGVDNIDSLAELTEIRDLDLRGNHLTNLNFAASMPHLTYLNISGNAIEDLSPLRDCHELNELIANDVPVKDWSAVEGVEKVEGKPPEPVEPEPSILVSRISISKGNLTLQSGEKATLTATVSPSDASDKTVKWSSSNSSVATVSNNGVVKAVKSGHAEITASCGGHKATCSVSVKDDEPIPVSGISISKGSLILQKGEYATLTATVSPSNAADKTVKWSSSDSSVVKVDDGGQVSAVGSGSAVITASCGGSSATCNVSVS